MQRVRVTNIVWDTDGEDVNLPTEVMIENEDHEALAEPDDVTESLSANYGFLVESCEYEVLKGADI